MRKPRHRAFDNWSGVASSICSSEIADLSSAQARTRFLDQHTELVHAEFVCDLTALVPQLAKSDRTKTLAVAELAMAIAERLKDGASLALGLRAKGNALYALGQNKAAIEHHRKALRRFRSLGDLEQVARTLSSSIQPLILQGRYGPALEAAREARKIFTRQGNRWRIARLDLNVGNIFDRQDRFRKALACYKRAYLYLSSQASKDPEAVAVALHNMAVSYVSLNDFRSALTSYEEARRLAAFHEMPVLIGQADYNIAWLHYLRGDYNRAISILRAARDICGSAGDVYHVALCHLDLSEIYLELNLHVEAEEAAEQACASFSLLGIHYERAKSIANLAMAIGRQGKTDRALELFVQARQIFAKEKNRVLPFVIDLYRAHLLYNEGRNTEAQQMCLSALHAFQRFNLSSKAVDCRMLLARLHLRDNDASTAEQESARALKSLSKLELPVMSCEAYAIRGQIQVAVGQERRAYRAYRRARDHFEHLRDGIQGEELKVSFMKDRVEIYEALVALCMKHLNPSADAAEIFEYVQQAKSRTLLDVLSTYGTDALASRVQKVNAREMHELREELNWYFHKIEKAQLQQEPHNRVNDLRAQRRLRELEFLKLQREHAPAENQGVMSPCAATLTIDQVRTCLPENAAILEYFQVQGQIIVVFLSHGACRIEILGKVSRISTLLELLQLQLSKLRLGPGYVATFKSALLRATQAHLHELHKFLIDPIRGLSDASHIVVAPHGILHNVPFQALFDGSHYLIDKVTVSYAPSASVYGRCQGRHARTPGGSLVVGVPDASVPFVEDEVEAVAACLPGSEVLMGRNATVENLRQKGQNSRFIHIATHGYFRRDNPMFSGVRMGDSYLSLYDLYQMRFPAELVTLSGCSTGLSVVSAGDEQLGLARGLIHAGVETSMLTQWDVQDRSSSQLMTFFYSHLAAGRSKPHALQQAMWQLKSMDPHPYHWAPFMLVGKS